MNQKYMDAKMDACAFLIASLDRDGEGLTFLLQSLETREDHERVIVGLTCLAHSLAAMSFADPRQLVQQWARTVVDEANRPPRNADERRRGDS